jgi:hypothetical protein
MGKLVQLPRSRPLPSAGDGAGPSSSRAEPELLPVIALLFVASLARVVRALWVGEPFDTEPTFALVFVVGLPWLALRWRKRK